MPTNGCNNRPRPEAGKPLLVQDGYFNTVDEGWGNLSRRARYHTVPFTMYTECQYDASATDPGCSGCAHAPHLKAAP